MHDDCLILSMRLLMLQNLPFNSIGLQLIDLSLSHFVCFIAKPTMYFIIEWIFFIEFFFFIEMTLVVAKIGFVNWFFFKLTAEKWFELEKHFQTNWTIYLRRVKIPLNLPMESMSTDDNVEKSTLSWKIRRSIASVEKISELNRVHFVLARCHMRDAFIRFQWIGSIAFFNQWIHGICSHVFHLLILYLTLDNSFSFLCLFSSVPRFLWNFGFFGREIKIFVENNLDCNHLILLVSKIIKVCLNWWHSRSEQ